MRAADRYEVREVAVPARRRYRGWRGWLAGLVTVTGDPLDPGGHHLEIVDHTTGATVHTITTPLGDFGTLFGRVQEDLLTISPEEFEERRILPSD